LKFHCLQSRDTIGIRISNLLYVVI
jgi:hypothetical protein